MADPQDVASAKGNSFNFTLKITNSPKRKEGVISLVVFLVLLSVAILLVYQSVDFSATRFCLKWASEPFFILSIPRRSQLIWALLLCGSLHSATLWTRQLEMTQPFTSCSWLWEPKQLGWTNYSSRACWWITLRKVLLILLQFICISLLTNPPLSYSEAWFRVGFWVISKSPTTRLSQYW